jgi:hypothetical protein
MKIAGFEWISTFRLIKISDGEYVTAICFFEKIKVGFYMKEVMQCQILKEKLNAKENG